MDVIDFLEHMGQSADLRHAGREDMACALESADLGAVPSAAILDGDDARLRAALGQVTFMSVQLPADEEEGGLDEQLPGDDSPGAPTEPTLP